ncbi:hypothetical protein V6N13_043456 [Hibiscus sabdariffa]
MRQRGSGGQPARRKPIDNRSQRSSQPSQIVTLFVENIPESLHWQGLWHAFRRHGDVVDAFIEKKYSRGGKRFGFVRYAKMGDAERALERLNGFVLYGSKLFVTLAKFNMRQAFWRKVNPGEKRKRILENHEEQINLESSEGKEVNRTTWRNEESREPYEGTGKSNDQKGLKNKRISGHVENEDLWSFKKCLIGRMASICSVRSVMTRLEGWGLGEISVRRLGGKTFLLNIEDEDLFIMLEDVNWSYLREIFEEVIPWSEEPIQLEGATWLEITGLLLHCWNHVTIKRLAELWGTFEALGENANCVKDCEKVIVLISTQNVQKIEEMVEIEVGDRIHLVRVLETGFSDNSNIMRKESAEGKGRTGSIQTIKGSQSSFSSSESSRSGSSEEVRGSKHHEEDEALNGCFIGREQNDIRSTDTREPNRHLGERDVKANKHALEVIEKEAPSSGEGIRVMEQESGHAVTLEVNTDILDK